MNRPKPSMRVQVDPTNPGQYFACCGLLELADRLWGEAEGWFEVDEFCIRSTGELPELVQHITDVELVQVEQDNATSSPIVLQGEAFKNLRIDWWQDVGGGGRELKVWAGTMESVRIARAMQGALRDPRFSTSELFQVGVIAFDPDNPAKKVEPYYFDARRAPNAHSRDVGFSPNDLQMTTTAYPAVELLCLIGLQRCLPAKTDVPRVFDYFTWAEPILPLVAWCHDGRGTYTWFKGLSVRKLVSNRPKKAQSIPYRNSTFSMRSIMSVLKKYDGYLSDDGPVALVIREYLMPVEGASGIVFPATYASGDGFPGGYNIDSFDDGHNVCLIDSVGSQANRIEPLFAQEAYRELIPQIVVRAGEKEVNLLEAGHRAGDALVRCCELQQPLQDAFKAVLMGNCEPLAKIAPTSLVFGVWDSRDTQAKLPRLVASTIRAYNVRELRRSAQFVPAMEYVNDGLLDEPGDKATKDAYSERGFIHVPASGSHGGVIAEGGIERHATLGLAALRQLHAGSDSAPTLALQRYVLGLALTAFTYNSSGYLRQGCLLVLDPDKTGEFVEVHATGKRLPAKITHEDALAYARETAKEFGVGESHTVEFDKARAKKDIAGEGNTKSKGKKAKKGQAADTEN